MNLCRFILSSILREADSRPNAAGERKTRFSLAGLARTWRDKTGDKTVAQRHVEEALLFLRLTHLVKFSGGFFVAYNRLTIRRLNRKDASDYSDDDYAPLRAHYAHRRECIHIVGEYARLMLTHPDVSPQFVRDYFNLEHDAFIKRHLGHLRHEDLSRSLTPLEFRRLFGDVTGPFRTAIDDKGAGLLVVTGATGSGKTEFLLRRLAAYVYLEGGHADETLILTYSRTGANEFRKRLSALIGSAASGMRATTFHAHSLDLLGVPPDETAPDNDETPMARAVRALMNGKAEPSAANTRLLLIDDAHHLAQDDYDLIRALMKYRKEMRLVVTGDEAADQPAFKGDSPRFFKRLAAFKSATHVSLDEAQKTILRKDGRSGELSFPWKRLTSSV